MGIQLRKMMRARVVVVFGATSRIGRATIEALSSPQQQLDTSVVVVAAVDSVKDPRARRLKRATKCYLVKCVFSEKESIQRAVRNADAVLLVPALSESGTRFSKRVIDAVRAEAVPRLVILSSILATNDFWRRRHHREDAAEAEGPVAAAAASVDFGYEAVEAHARSALENCVSLRIPLLMETIMFCREEIKFAGRFNGCFAPDTLVPCIAASDVGAAAAHVLAKPMVKFDPTYCLASADVACSPHEIERELTRALGKCVKYRQVPDEHLVELLRERGATQYVAQSMVRLKNYLEFGNVCREHPLEEKEDELGERKQPGAPGARGAEDPPSREDVAARRLQTARFGYTTDFQRLVGREMMAPAAWLEAHQKHFDRSADSEMQLFVLGSGEGLFAEFERFLAWQVTSASTAPAAAVGEAAIPTTSSGAMQGKITFCSITSISKPTGAEGGTQPHRDAPEHYYCHVQGRAVSPIDQLAKQLSQLDVVVYIPPLHLNPDERFEITRVVVDAARKADVWGIVLVSTIYTGIGSGELLNRAGRVEQLVERSGLPFVIVRLPLFMEYFTALASADHLNAVEETASERTTSGGGARDNDDELKPPAAHGSAAADSRIPAREAHWNMLDRSLATSRLCLISMADAVKALAAIAYTFPLHRNHTRALYTECLTVHEIETVLKENAYRNRPIDFAQVDALYEHPTREFWRLAYWTKAHTREFLECAVALSAQAAPIEMSMDFEEITECAPISLARWARANAKSFTHSLQVGGGSVRESL